MKLDDVKLFEIMNHYENLYKDKGFENIVGIDEVGRGPIAGSLVVAGVILNEPILGLKDSKKLSRTKISFLSKEIINKAKAYKIIEVRATTIDKIGIKKAVAKAMQRIVNSLECDFALIDFEKPNLKIESLSLKKGDNLSNSIAAASIIAKNYRDNKMIKLSKKHPEYGFEKHVGYGTKLHVEMLLKYGILEKIHRKSFQPVKKMAQKK